MINYNQIELKFRELFGTALEGCELLEKGDIRGFGKQMYGSHEGLSHLYEVSCPELDFLVSFTRDKDYVAGARMMGGGFGGCTINFVDKAQAANFIKEAAQTYHQAFCLELKTYEVAISAGTGSVERVKKTLCVLS